MSDDKLPYTVKRKEYRLDKADDKAIEVYFTIKGPTVCTKKFTIEADAKRECATMNEIYKKGYEARRKEEGNG